MRPGRVLIFIVFLICIVFFLPQSKSVFVKTATYSFFQKPLSFSAGISQFFLDLWFFRKNANQLRMSKLAPDDSKGIAHEVRIQELLLENQRLTKMLEIRNILESQEKQVIVARVIARSPSEWNRVLLIDKGSQHGIKVNRAVFSNSSLIGKIAEVGPWASKVILMTDPNSRIGALIQRTRDQGILYGAFTGQCRMKYLSVNADIVPGDIVESAGYGGFFPKAAMIGKVEKVWKEPGQIYKVAEISPLTDLNRLEEVACLD